MTNIYNFVKNNQVITFFCLSASQAMHHGYSPASQTGLYKSYLAVILILMVSNLATLLTAFLIFGDKPSLYMFKYEPLGIFIINTFRTVWWSDF